MSSASSQAKKTYPLVQWNEMVEARESDTDAEVHDEIMQAFIWESDPNERFHVDVLFNQMHLLGLLACRSAANVDAQQQPPHSSCSHEQQRLQICDSSPSKMTLKEIKDTLANMQLEWPSFVQVCKASSLLSAVPRTREYLQQCMHRVGVLLARAHDASVLNDVQDTCAHTPESENPRRLTSSAIRRLLESLLLLNRHLDLCEMCEELQPLPYEVGVTPYHHEASMDRFHKLCMYFYLPVAARLHYKHDFPGMYNDISQVVYFHDADYKQKAREPHTSTTPIHMLASVCLLYPEVQVRFEDDCVNPSADQGWYWLVVPLRVYLVSPEPKVYFCEDLSTLVGLYVRARASS